MYWDHIPPIILFSSLFSTAADPFLPNSSPSSFHVFFPCRACAVATGAGCS